jgi:hypothetical protein
MNYNKYRITLFIILFSILNTGGIIGADTNDIMLVSVSSQNVPESVIPVVENRVIYSFSKTGLYTVIERREIAKIIKEQKFSLSGLIDDKTAIEAGKLIGADVSALVHMTFIDKLYYFDIKIIDNRTSKIRQVDHISPVSSIVDVLNGIPSLITRISGVSQSKEDNRIPIRKIRINRSVFNISALIKHVVHSGPVVSILSYGGVFYTVGKKGEIYKWDKYDQGSAEKVFQYKNWVFEEGVIGNEGKNIAVAGLDSVIYLWDTSRWGSPYQLIQSGVSNIKTSFSSHQPSIYTGDSKGQIAVWDIKYQSVEFFKPVSSLTILSLLENSDGSGILYSTNNGEICLYNLSEKRTWFCESSGIRGEQQVLQNHQGQILLSYNGYGDAVIWDKSLYSSSRFIGGNWIKSGITHRKNIQLDKKGLNIAVFAPSDDLIVFGFKDGGLIVFDAITWEPLVNNFDKKPGITAVNFIDNQHFITGHIDGAVMRWMIE